MAVTMLQTIGQTDCTAGWSFCGPQVDSFAGPASRWPSQATRGHQDRRRDQNALGAHPCSTIPEVEYPPRKRMLIELERQDDVCVLRLTGSLVTGTDPEYLRAKAAEIKSQSCNKLLADLRELLSIGRQQGE